MNDGILNERRGSLARGGKRTRNDPPSIAVVDQRMLLAFGALAQNTRLRVFRLLVRNHPEGMTPSDLAREIVLPHNTLSSHLATMRASNLVSARRAEDGRSQIYTANIEFVGESIAYLMKDCCKGRPELCRSIFDAALLGKKPDSRCDCA